jgi:hypothetical protein
MDAANIALALEALIRLTMQTQALAQLIQRARSENRDITMVELDALCAADDQARVEFDAAIGAARKKLEG